MARNRTKSAAKSSSQLLAADAPASKPIADLSAVYPYAHKVDLSKAASVVQADAVFGILSSPLGLAGRYDHASDHIRLHGG